MVIAEHLDRDHGESLTPRGVDFSRHDGGAWFVGWNLEFAETGAGTASIPTNVVADLHQRAGKRAERSAHAHHAIVRRKRRELVGRRNKRFAGLLRDSPGGHLSKAWIGVEARAHRRASDGQRVHPMERLANAVECLVELRDPTRDHLAEGQWRRVLKMRPPDHDNVAIS